MQHKSIKRKSKGVSMIEVLVTIVVLSIGLLGMAALQMTGLRSINSASYRTQATLLISDIAERVRSNPTAVDNDLFAIIDSSANIDCTTFPATYCGEYYDDDAVVNAASCNSTQLANYDLNVWFCGINADGARAGGVQASLPQATATIACNDTNPPAGDDGIDCTDGSPHTITLNWTELNPNRTAADNTVTQTIAITIQP